MQKFLSENKKYPAEAIAAGIEGTVSIRYTISYQGNVIKTKILAGLGYGCDEEAIRVVSLLKFALPKTRKIKAQYHKTVHLHFRLPQNPVPAPAQMSVNYEMIPKSIDKSKTKGTIQKAGSYHYQITP